MRKDVWASAYPERFGLRGPIRSRPSPRPSPIAHLSHLPCHRWERGIALARNKASRQAVPLSRRGPVRERDRLRERAGVRAICGNPQGHISSLSTVSLIRHLQSTTYSQFLRRAKSANEPSQANRRTGRNDCNSAELSEVAAAHGWATSLGYRIENSPSLRCLGNEHLLTREITVRKATHLSYKDNLVGVGRSLREE